jgi:hypothetical protein
MATDGRPDPHDPHDDADDYFEALAGRRPGKPGADALRRRTRCAKASRRVPRT